ncbi:MAG: hypothetical protein NC094_13300 [Bacteroidales bacterium]|nr:hypothetical protein [Lachnoclostridium sp.]MCM1383595.1 hypothetical protein [Lachnoclostridium sp.]MCM1466382.1 hypothetical protein [Bacteroidales bacterium]
MKTKDVTDASAAKNAAKQVSRRALEEMNLLDDFLFVSMVGYPGLGERFVGSLLKTIFGREFRHLTVTAQKVFYGADTGLHGARLDVYIEPEGEEPEGKAAVYDIEPDRQEDSAGLRSLPRRVRFYHGKMAARSLSSGADYDTLKDVVIIMIMPYDPFGLNRMVYTVKNRCVEEPGMEYEDGASTLFLYTKGKAGEPSKELRQMLHYMEETTYENAVNRELQEIHRMVETVKKDPGVVGMHIKMADEIMRMSQKITRQEEEITRQAEENARQAEENARQAEENAKQAEENAKQAEEITRQEEEITRLREELALLRGMEKPEEHI